LVRGTNDNPDSWDIIGFCTAGKLCIIKRNMFLEETTWKNGKN